MKHLPHSDPQNESTQFFQAAVLWLPWKLLGEPEDTMVWGQEDSFEYGLKLNTYLIWGKFL